MMTLSERSLKRIEQSIAAKIIPADVTDCREAHNSDCLMIFGGTACTCVPEVQCVSPKQGSILIEVPYPLNTGNAA